MANLPSVTRENAVTPQTPSSVSPSDRARPFDQIAQGLDSIGTTLTDWGRMAEQAQVATVNDAAKTSAVTLSQQANGDPQAFQTSWKAYSDSILAKVPASQRATVEQNLIGYGGETYRGMLGTKFNLDQDNANKALKARTDSLTNDLSDLAAAGQTDSEAYKAKHNELVGIFNERTGNPAFGYTKDQANLDLANTEDKLNGAAVTGDLERTYASGGLVAAQQRADEIINDKTSSLSQIQKYKAVQAGIASVRSLYAVDVQSRSEFSAAKDTAVSALADGSLRPDDPFVGQLMQTADALKDPVARLAIQTAQSKAYLNPMKSMSLHDGLNFLQNGGGTGAASIAADMLRKEEGFGATAAWDVNAFRAGYGADTVTKADGTIVKVTAGMAVNQADAERDLQRQLPELNAQGAKAIGDDAWAKMPPAAQAAVMDLVYNHGGVPDTVVAAAQTGDMGKVADAVAALPAWSKDPQVAKVLLGRRQREAAMIRGGSGPAGGGLPSGYVKGAIPEAIANVKTELDTALTQAETQVGKFPLNDKQVGDLVQAARYVNDDAVYSRVQAVIAKSDGIAATLGTPISDRSALLAKMRAPGAGQDAFTADMLGSAEATTTRQLTDLKTDARGVGIEQGLFKAGPAIDWSKMTVAPGYRGGGAAITVGGVLQQRASQAASMETYNKLPPGSVNVLRPDEATDLAGKIAAAPDAQAAILSVQQAAGGAWPRVFSDLVTKGKLPAGYQSVASLDDPKDAALLARALNETKPKADGSQPPRTWDDILGTAGSKGVAADLREKVRTDPNVMNFERSLSASGASAKQVDDIVSSVETLAYAEKFYNNDGNPAASAIKAFIGNYNFSLPGSPRVPAKFFDATSTNARTALQSVDASKIAVPQAFGQQGGPTADDYLTLLKANPTWVTSPREDALWLMDNQGRIVRDKSGVPFQVPFTDKVTPTATSAVEQQLLSGGGYGALGPAPDAAQPAPGIGAAAGAAVGAAAQAAPVAGDNAVHAPDLPQATIKNILTEDVFNSFADGGMGAAIKQLNAEMDKQGVTGKDAAQMRAWFTSHFGQ